MERHLTVLVVAERAPVDAQSKGGHGGIWSEYPNAQAANIDGQTCIYRQRRATRSERIQDPSENITRYRRAAVTRLGMLGVRGMCSRYDMVARRDGMGICRLIRAAGQALPGRSKRTTFNKRLLTPRGAFSSNSCSFPYKRTAPTFHALGRACSPSPPRQNPK